MSRTLTVLVAATVTASVALVYRLHRSLDRSLANLVLTDDEDLSPAA